MSFSTSSVSTSTTPVVSTSNLPTSAAQNSGTSFDPSQSSISSAHAASERSNLETFFASFSTFNADLFKEAYNALSAEKKKAYLSFVEVVQKNTGKDAVIKIVAEKGDFEKGEQQILQDVADIRSNLETFFASFSTFKADLFKEAYNALSAEKKKAYLSFVEVVQKNTGKDAVIKIVAEKGDFEKGEQQILQDAADMMKSIPALKTLSSHLSLVADGMLVKLDGGFDVVFEELPELLKVYNSFPKPVSSRLLALKNIFAPRLELYTSAERRGDTITRGEALMCKAKAHAMMTLAKNGFKAIGDQGVREELIIVLRIIAQKGTLDDGDVSVSEADICSGYKLMGAVAQKTLADAVGHAIGKPRSGEQYIRGRLRNGGRLVVPNVQLIAVVLKNLVAFDGIEDVPEELQGIVFSPLI